MIHLDSEIDSVEKVVLLEFIRQLTNKCIDEADGAMDEETRISNVLGEAEDKIASGNKKEISYKTWSK